MKKSRFHRAGLVTYVITTLVAWYILFTRPMAQLWELIFVAPLLLAAMMFMDAAASEEQEETFENPLIGQKVTVEETFSAIGDSFEGAVQLNGARWLARSQARCHQQGDLAQVTRIDGHTLHIE